MADTPDTVTVDVDLVRQAANLLRDLHIVVHPNRDSGPPDFGPLNRTVALAQQCAAELLAAVRGGDRG